LEIINPHKALRAPVYQLLSEKRSSHCALLPAAFNLLPTSTNQELFENQLRNQNSQYEKYRKFTVTKKKPSHTATESTLFAVSKDEWNTQQGTGKSMKNALYILQCAKKCLSGQNNIKQ